MIVKHIEHSYSRGSVSPFFAEKEGKQLRPQSNEDYLNVRKALGSDYRLLTLDYQVHRARLVTLKNDHTLVSHVQEALKVAKMLEEIYRDSVLTPFDVASSEVARYRTEIEEYEKWLKCANQDFPVVNNGQSYTAEIRNWTAFLNFPRLLSVRSRRAFVSLAPLTSGSLSQFIKGFEDSTRWMASYQAWIFFLPRLLSNLIFFCKHVIDNPWMTQTERDLGWRTRLAIQSDRRWIELANDISWFSSGFIACFVLTGTWGFFGVYLNAITQFLDIVFAVIRISNERHRYLELQKSYQTLEPDPFQNDSIQLAAHLDALTERLNIERQLLWLAFVNPVVLTIAAVLLCCTATPILPFVGGLLAVAMTIANFFTTQYIRGQIPATQVRAFLLANPRNASQPSFLPVSKSVDCINEMREASDTVDRAMDGEDQQFYRSQSALGLSHRQ